MPNADNSTPILLGINIDHVATLRQARGTRYPDPVTAAMIAEQSGADSITFHLREDRRHIQERDCQLLKEMVQTKLNLEMAVTDDMLQFAYQLQPQDCCLVPEKREELTTEGGLDAAANIAYLKDYCASLSEDGVRVSLFIDAEPRQLEAAVEIGAPVVEIHTGHYAEARAPASLQKELARIAAAVSEGRQLGLQVNAGHGLDYHNVKAVAAIDGIDEFNIGHAIVCRALFAGMYDAVADMKQLLQPVAAR